MSAKRNRLSTINSQPSTSPVAPVVGVAQEVAKFQKRNAQIQARLGVINAEAAKLSAEQHGIELRLLELSRDFDRHVRA